MKRKTKLVMKQFFWMLPIVIICSPWMLFETLIEWLARALNRLDCYVARGSSNIGRYLPPKWWPSHAIRRELWKELHKEREETKEAQ